MTRDEIIKIYCQVSDELCGGAEWCWSGVSGPLEKFAALVAAHEREACAALAQNTICDTHIPTGVHIYGTRVAKAIKARGQG